MIRFIKVDRRGPRVVTIPRWAIGLGLVTAFLMGVLALAVAAGIALLAIPTLLVAGGVAAWLNRGKAIGRPGAVARPDAHAADPSRRDPFAGARPGPGARPRPDVVDAEFRVVERDERR